MKKKSSSSKIASADDVSDSSKIASADDVSDSSKIASADNVSDSSKIASADNVSGFFTGSVPTRIYCFEASFKSIWPHDDHEMTTMDYNASISPSKFSTWDEQYDVSRYGKVFVSRISRSDSEDFVYFAKFFQDGRNGVEYLPIERVKSCVKKMSCKAIGRLTVSESIDAVACKIANPSLPNETFLERFGIPKSTWENIVSRVVGE